MDKAFTIVLAVNTMGIRQGQLFPFLGLPLGNSQLTGCVSLEIIRRGPGFNLTGHPLEAFRIQLADCNESRECIDVGNGPVLGQFSDPRITRVESQDS
ncbi:hypothetical protein D3C79_915140 [compost metagenome]